MYDITVLLERDYEHGWEVVHIINFSLSRKVADIYTYICIEVSFFLFSRS